MIMKDLAQELGEMFNKECRWSGMGCQVTAAEREAFLKALITYIQATVMTEEQLTRALLATEKKYRSQQERATAILANVGSWT